MKLKRFKAQDHKRKFIIIFTVCCIFLLAGVFLYTTFAVFTEEKEFNVINGKYQDPGDLYFAFYVDGEITNTFPNKDSGYTLDEAQSSCTNGAEITWDNDTWSAAINFSNYFVGNMSRTKCTMYFVEMSFSDSILACNDTAANCITKNADKNTEELVYDETVDNNLRYIGSDVNNYVLFNDELWRLMEVMNNVVLEDGTTTSLLKIVRNESIGEYSFDNNRSFKNIYSEVGIKDTLNSGPYWNRTSGTCPFMIGALSSTLTTACDFTNTGLTENAKTMISSVVWNLGAVDLSSSISEVLAQERSGNTTWTGYVGLVYPSDFLYSVNLSEECSEKTPSEGSETCYDDGDLHMGYSITALASTTNSAIRVGDALINAAWPTWNPMHIYPSLYLNSDIKIVSGTGVESDPYIFSL